MLKEYRVKDISPKANTKDELMDIYYSFPGYRDKIKRAGLIAMELE